MWDFRFFIWAVIACIVFWSGLVGALAFTLGYLL